MAPPTTRSTRWYLRALLPLLAVILPALILWNTLADPIAPTATRSEPQYQPRRPIDNSGFYLVASRMQLWPANAELDRIAAAWHDVGYRLCADVDADLNRGSLPPEQLARAHLTKAGLLNYEGEAEKAYAALEEARNRLDNGPAAVAAEWLYTIIWFQGVSALRWGETDNCVLCRGESSCILPIAPAAYHTKPTGSRRAIKHFTEYLNAFPEDLETRWLLNVAHMTLGEYPAGVDHRFLVSLERYTSPEHGIGKFRDIGHSVGINRLNQAGGAILDDFDGDDRLDIVFTTTDPTKPMVFYHNKGDGTFEDRTKDAGLSDQLGGLNCVQADYNNDGFLDIFIPRGAWLQTPMRPTLLRNNGNGTFTDVTKEAGLIEPTNSITAQWADYDNDGHPDLFVCNETGPARLYHNRGNGTFEEVSVKAGLTASGVWKGVAWIDFDGDRLPDLFLNDLGGRAKLYRNRGNGTFQDVSIEMGIDGPRGGFSCWAFDYDNDGWPDIFAANADKDVTDVVKGLTGAPLNRHVNRLFRNVEGKRFQDITTEAGLDVVFAVMGSNFGDFDNDGFLDFYLGTGSPSLSALVPNRMFRNLGGKRFADITGSSGTGHLQKGHGVAIGDWRRSGDPDIVIEMGGAVNGDKYHNVLFQNPGSGNNWLNVKLVGKRTNRSARARIKVVTAGADPRAIYRWVSSGSSFGANPLEQHFGLGPADRVARVEVFWPTSNTTQVFENLTPNQGIEVTEFANNYRQREYKPITVPK